jgi:hypothetical protein
VCGQPAQDVALYAVPLPYRACGLPNEPIICAFRPSLSMVGWRVVQQPGARRRARGQALRRGLALITALQPPSNRPPKLTQNTRGEKTASS